MAKKVKIKRVFIRPKEDYRTEIKEEIRELEQKKAEIPKGIKGTLQKLAINKAINDRRRYLGTKREIALTKEKVALGKEKVELEKVKAELQQKKKKSQINFSDIFPSDNRKQVKF